MGTVNIPNTGGWQNWQTVSFDTVVNAGTYSLGMYAAAGGWNFNWIEVIQKGGSGSVATVWEHCNYAGWSASLDEGSHTRAALEAKGFINDKASSIQLAPGYEALVYLNNNFGGASHIYKASDSCMNNEGFNDNVSSIVVRKAGGGNGGASWSDEFDSINRSNWSFETGGGGWGNNELQYYTNGDNAFIQYDNQVNSNVLVIEARQEGGFDCWYGPCKYTSTRMISRVSANLFTVE